MLPDSNDRLERHDISHVMMSICHKTALMVESTIAQRYRDYCYISRNAIIDPVSIMHSLYSENKPLPGC